MRSLNVPLLVPAMNDIPTSDREGRPVMGDSCSPNSPRPLRGLHPEAPTVSLSADASIPLTASGRVWAGTATVRDSGDIDSVLLILLDALQRNNFSLGERESVQLALREAIANAIAHGHKCDPTKQVRIRYLINPVGLLAQIEDEGPGFRPDWILNPTNHQLPVGAGECLPAPSQGRGLRLMRQHMTEVRYNACGNCVTLVKRRNECGLGLK